MKRYHYLYMIEHMFTGKFYLGIRSCDCKPEEDTSYMGSGSNLKDISNKLLRKKILSTFADRSIADAVETLIVNEDFCFREDTFNMRTGGEHGILIDRHRQREGIAKAKERGVYKGRKPSVDVEKVRELKAEGLGASAIAKQMGIGRASVYRAMEDGKYEHTKN
jgi:hypothetical protein